MSCTISISDNKDDIWMIRNAIYRWMIEIIKNKYPNEREISDILLKSSYLGGISLEMEYQDEPDLTVKIAKVLLTISREISDGKHTLADDFGKPWPELQDQCQASFKELFNILKRAPFIEEVPNKKLNG